MDSASTPKKRKCLLFGIDLNQPEEAAEAILPPQPQQEIKGHYASLTNFRDKCSLFGCEIAPQEEGVYCCNSHLQFAELWSSSATKAYQVYDGLEKERRQPLSLACLLLKLDGVESGIPTLDTGLVFSKVPWENGEVCSQSHVPTYTSRDWLFFATPPRVHKTMKYGSDMYCQWHGQHTNMILFDQQYITSTPRNLRMSLREKERRGEWRLYQFTYKGLSLYCVSHIVTPKETIPAQRSSKTTKTKAPPDSGGDAQGQGENSGNKDKNQGKESTTSITKTQSVGNHKNNFTVHNAFSVSEITSGWCKVDQRFCEYLELMKSRTMDAALPPMDGAFKRIMEQNSELSFIKKPIMDSFSGSFEVKLRKASTSSGDANPIQDFESIISRRGGNAWNDRATSEMEIVLLLNVCSVYLKSWSWDRSKKIITSILNSEAADSVVHEDAGDITVEQEPKLEG